MEGSQGFLVGFSQKLLRHLHTTSKAGNFSSGVQRVMIGCLEVCGTLRAGFFASWGLVAWAGVVPTSSRWNSGGAGRMLNSGVQEKLRRVGGES